MFGRSRQVRFVFPELGLARERKYDGGTTRLLGSVLTLTLNLSLSGLSLANLQFSGLRY